MTTNASQLQKVYLGADHGGFALKEKVKHWLTQWGIAFEDMGAHTFDATDDYPDFSFAVANAVVGSTAVTVPEQSGTTVEKLGVLICRSGGGMAIAANKVPGIFAVPVYNPVQAAHARNNDLANVITLSGDWMDEEMAAATLRVFLQTKPDLEPRHLRRIEKIRTYEEQKEQL